MSQIRFNIGVPRGGSAARIAEDGSQESTRSIRPQAGSAARAAEERNRAESSAGPRAFSIGMRARGARASVPPGASGGAAASSTTVEPRASETVSRQSAGPVSSVYVHAGSSTTTAPSTAPLSAEQADEAFASSRPPIKAASRVKSLVQALFSSGSAPGKS